MHFSDIGWTTRLSFRQAFFLVLFVLSLSSTYAGKYTFNLYDVSDGLPSPVIFAICQDTKGLLWLGTTAGVSRFDGKHFVNYNTSDGLLNNRITGLYENSKNEILIGTYKGVSVFNGSTFKHYKSPKNINISWYSYFFEWQKGKMQVILNDHLYQLNDGEFERLSLHKDMDSLAHNEIVQLADGTRAFASEGKLFMLSPKKELKAVSFDKEIYACISQSKKTNDVVVVAEDGVYKLTNNRFQRLFYHNFVDKILLGMLMDSQNRIWISIESGGVMLFEQNELTIIGEKDGLNPLFTTCIFEDNSGKIWMGNGRGLYQVKTNHVKLYNTSNGLSENDIRHIYLGRDRKIYLGQNSTWFAYIEEGKIRQPSLPVQKKLSPVMAHSRVSGFAVDEKDRLWIGKMGGMLLRVNGEEVEDLSQKFGPVDFYDQQMYFNQQDSTVWLPLRRGIVLIRGEKIVRRIEQKPDGSPLGYILKVKPDSSGRIWFSTKTELFFYKDQKVHKVEMPTVASNTSKAFECQQNGLLWFTTENNGVMGCRLVKNKLITKENINIKNGLPALHASSVTPDRNRGLWIATVAGICRVNPEGRSVTGRYNVYQFSRTDGIPFSNYGVTQLVTDTRGDIWNTNLDGLLHFDLHAPYLDTLPPAILMEKIDVRSRERGWQSKSVRLNGMTCPGSPVLQYYENNIALYFTGVFLTGNTLSYQYRLSGVQSNWQEQTGNAPVNYYNLPAGDYTFYIKAIAPQGTESKVIKYNFTILPPFWMTWWFRILVVLFFMYLVYVFVKRRERAIKHENGIHLQMSELRMQALQAQMNPHFIFNSLNSIQSYIINNDAMSAAKYLSKFAKLIRRILDNSKHSFIPFEEVIDVLKMYVELEAFRFSHEFAYSFTVEEDDDLMNMPFPPMLLQPFVENAIWHGLMPKTGSKRLTVDVSRQNDEMVCIVEDNGVGRQVQKVREGHISQGEKITKGLLESMQNIQNLSATLEISDKSDDNGPAGTIIRITVSLPQRNPKS